MIIGRGNRMDIFALLLILMLKYRPSFRAGLAGIYEEKHGKK
jgi:hypothetical protein